MRVLKCLVVLAALSVSACGHADTTVANIGSHSGSGGVLPTIRQGKSDFYPTWIRLVTNTWYGSGITLGPDHDIWVSTGNSITRIDYWRTMRSFPLGQAFGSNSLATGPDGNIWFTDFGGSNVGRLNPATGKVDVFHTPSGGQPLYLCAGHDGNMWFTEPDSSGNVIARITMSGVITEFSASATPAELAAGPDGDVYFGMTGAGGGVNVGRIDPSGQISYQPVGGDTFEFSTGPEGNVYFIDYHFSNNQTELSTITSGFNITRYAWPSTEGVPGPVAAGPDGNVWIGAQLNKQVVLTIFDVHSKQFLPQHPSSPGTKYSIVGDMVTGRDGNIWWTDKYQTDVYVYHSITASPDPMTFSAPGQQQTLTASETNFSGTLTAQSSNTGVVTVQNGGTKNTFTVTSVAPGDTLIRIYDGNFNNLGVHVVVQ
jgi:streptogramin lyase